MRLNELRDNPGASRKVKRIGRGIGSGKGKTAGKGHKGQNARSGVALREFEGGQMPLYRRLPKRGFKAPDRKAYDPINLDRLQEAIDRKRIDAGQPVTEETLRNAGLAGRTGTVGVRLLARGELTAKLTLDLSSASKAAIEAVKKAGGTITVKQREKKKRLRGSEKTGKGVKGAKGAAAQAEAGAS
jgi:large subunit ribosomal protein L15